MEISFLLLPVPHEQLRAISCSRQHRRCSGVAAHRDLGCRSRNGREPQFLLPVCQGSPGLSHSWPGETPQAPDMPRDSVASRPSPKRPPDAGRVMLASLVLLQTSSQGDKGTCAWSRTQSPHSGGWEGSLKAAPPHPGLLFLAVFKPGARGARWGGDRAAQAEREEVG